MIRQSFFCSAVVAFIFCVSAVAQALPRLSSPAGSQLTKTNAKCSARVGQIEDYRDLVQKVSIRGEDTRTASKEFGATGRVGCKNTQGELIQTGSANFISSKKIATVLHNVVDLETCKPLFDLDQCFIVHKGKPEFIRDWAVDPAEMCRQNKTKNNGDGFIVAELKKKSDVKNPYKILCSKDLDKKIANKVTAVGARAANSDIKLGPGENIVGSGDVFKIDKEKQIITYEADTGLGTSGGAIVTEIDGKKYLIAVDAGDSFNPAVYGLDQNIKDWNGYKADPQYNYGYGYLIDSNQLKEECGNGKKEVSQDEMSI